VQLEILQRLLNLTDGEDDTSSERELTVNLRDPPVQTHARFLLARVHADIIARKDMGRDEMEAEILMQFTNEVRYKLVRENTRGDNA
jgi:hypothetical protein